MYQVVNGILTLSKADWLAAGLTENMLWNDSKRGKLEICDRSIYDNTLINAKSIKNPRRLRVIEGAYGPIEKTDSTTGHVVVLDSEALSFFQKHRYGNDIPLPENIKQQYYNEASILNTLKSIFDKKRIALARKGDRIRMNEWWKECITFCKKQREQYPHSLPTSARSFERKYKAYLADGYSKLIHKNYGAVNAEKLTDKAKDWLIARYASPINKCTIMQLFMEYNDKARSMWAEFEKSEDKSEERKKQLWRELKSEQTIYKFLHKPEIQPLWYASRYGELLSKGKYTRQHKTLLPTMRDALWYGDGTKLNYFYLDENGKISTCYVYEAMDVYSECLLGYAVCKNEDFEAQYHAYKMAMHFSGHKPYEICFDNQGGHKKLQASTFFKSLARLAINTQPYNGQSKTIESAFGRFQADFLHKEWFFTGQNITAKKQESKINREFLNANKTNLPTFSEVIKIYEQRRQEWNEAKHFDTGISRIEMYRNSNNPKAPKVEFYDMISMFGVINDKSIKYRSNGIILTVKTQKYQYEVLTIEGQPDFDFLRSNVDREFHIGYDPEDMTTVSLYVKTPTGDYRFVSIAQKYIQIHRAKQEQDELDHAFIAAMDKKNKELRLSMQEETEQLLERNDCHPAQHGLNMPQPLAINRKKIKSSVGKDLKKESELMLIDDEINVYGTY